MITSLLMNAAKGAGSKAKQAASTKTGKNITTGVVIIAGSFASYYFLKKYLEAEAYKAAQSKFGSGSKQGLSTTYAARLHAAFYSTAEWFSNWIGDGTNNKEVDQVAKEMKANGVTFADVAAAYRALYKNELFKDFGRELDAAELKRFNNILNS